MRAEARPGVDGLLQWLQEQQHACSMPAFPFAAEGAIEVALPCPYHPPSHPQIAFQIVICVFVAGELAGLQQCWQRTGCNLH